jgi:HK97 family phage major capsid protein
MQHVMKRALRGSVALTLKGEDDDPVALVTKSIDDLRKAVDDKIAAIEAKAGDTAEVEKLVKRLDELEKKANRPGGRGTDNGDEEVEKKAIAALLRTGSDVELKAAASDTDPAGGYFVLPTVDLSVRNRMTDLSPLRSLAEVVSISSDRYERFYSLGKRGAQWVSERDDRPQDTARPELIKQSYPVSELYAAPVATRHLLDDASIDIASWLINNATHDFAETEGEAFLTGDGVDGRPLVTKDFTRAWGNFQYIPAGHASNPTDENLADALITLMMTLRGPYRGNARWLMNRTTAIRIRKLRDGDDRFLWAPLGKLLEGNRARCSASP